MSQKTLVIGASKDSYRYSNRLMRSLRSKGIPVIGLGSYDAEVEGLRIHSERIVFDDIDTISIYLRKEKQYPLYDYIMSLNPRRIIFNPGAENQELYDLAINKGVECTNACSLVMLSIGSY